MAHHYYSAPVFKSWQLRSDIRHCHGYEFTFGERAAAPRGSRVERTGEKPQIPFALQCD